jgi:tetratricopeptide (TPR) repeat protein
MAAANVAWILALNGERVLVIDWDLEAPGIYRYFHPFLEDKELLETEGLLDFVEELAGRAAVSSSPLSDECVDVVRYITMLKWPTRCSLDWEHFGPRARIDLLVAGRQGPAYSRKLNAFNWIDFYERLGGRRLLNIARRQVCELYDYILIDSRTGVSDTSGICTVEMPDTLVICFTLNDQNIIGSSGVAESVAGQRLNLSAAEGDSRGGLPFRIFPVPTRVEIISEQKKRLLAMELAQRKFARFIEHLSEEERSKYWGRLQAAYVPFYAFEEIPAVFGDPANAELSLTTPMKQIARSISDNSSLEVPSLAEGNEDAEQLRKEILGWYERKGDPSLLAAEVDSFRDTTDFKAKARGSAARASWLHQGVFLSSTLTDLEQHRAALIKVINGQGLAAVALENDSAEPDVDIIDSSLRMVRDASAYVGVISRKYGQTPECPIRNPGKLSITELEFNEAERLGRPILLFIMGPKHPLCEADVEIDAGNREKLNAFRERARRMRPDSPVHRVYATFDSLEEFTSKAIRAVANLRRYLDTAAPPAPTAADPIPAPPAFYAEPPYFGSHKFVGRKAQLDVLSDWVVPADPHPVILFDAIGGSGKSMLTWEWTTKHAPQVRADWAGRFWYSFYERGGIMADFCRRALAYITREPLENFRKMKTPELGERLLHHLQNRPWLLVLDGLERVLVAYHRFDAAEVPDEEANQPTDQIANRDPCAAIRPEDDDLLRALAAAAPSKLIVTSRLVPRVLLNPASQAIPGVLRVSLPGLRPEDAESLLRSCGVTGDSQTIQNYLKSHCDCHPLLTGAFAGLVNDYLPDRGNFDAWAVDPAGGGQLNLANLDLVQKRNHILKTALDGLPEKSRQLLSTLALLSEAVDYPTLSALNPHFPPKPEKVGKPADPKNSPRWERMSDAERKLAQLEYQVAMRQREEYKRALAARLQSPEFLAAPQELANTVHDLQRRGLLQYDGHSKRYDLHPVIRGIVAGGLRPEERDSYGQRVVDHFFGKTHRPYEEAETVGQVRDGLHVVRTLLKMGRYQQAYEAYVGDLSNALAFNLEAYAEVVSLLRPFFPEGWATLPRAVGEEIGSYLANEAAFALEQAGELEEASAAYGAALAGNLRSANWPGVRVVMYNISDNLRAQNRVSQEDRCLLLGLNVATLTGDDVAVFRAQLDRFAQLARIGRWADAQAIWDLLDPMGRNWPRRLYRPGDAEYGFAQFCFWQGDMSEEHLAHAEQLAKAGKNRITVRNLHGLRGQWRLERAEWALAAESLREAVSMARAVGQTDAAAETQLALAQFQLGQLTDPRREAEQLASARRPSHRALADLWLAIGDREQAKKHTLEAYKWAWADGEPYVQRYELNRARALLEKLGAEIPNLPPYDPAKDEKLPWEDEVASAIEKLRAEKEAKNREKESPPIP